MKCKKQFKHSNYVTLSRFHRTTVNNSGLTLANDSVYHYNAAGKLVKITDRNTNVVTISYDENKEEKSVIKTVTEKATGACIYLYYENGRLKKVYDDDDRTTELKYENDFLTEIKNPLGEITYYTYDENGLLLTRKNHDKKVNLNYS